MEAGALKSVVLSPPAVKLSAMKNLSFTQSTGRRKEGLRCAQNRRLVGSSPISRFAAMMDSATSQSLGRKALMSALRRRRSAKPEMPRSPSSSPIAAAEPLLHLDRGIVIEHLLTSGVSRDHPE